jgi:TRAP-type C4-dicarboxylate transport system permease small subunit
MILLLQRISLWINAIVEKILLVIGTSICLILFTQVLSRYIGASLGWSEEVSRHLLVAITFLGGTAAYKRMSFIGLKGIGHGIGPSIQKFIVVALQVATLGCFCILAWFGTVYTIKAWQHTTASLQIPMSIPFAVIPISSMVFIVHVLSDLATTFERSGK